MQGMVPVQAGVWSYKIVLLMMRVLADDSMRLCDFCHNRSFKLVIELAKTGHELALRRGNILWLYAV